MQRSSCFKLRSSIEPNVLMVPIPSSSLSDIRRRCGTRERPGRRPATSTTDLRPCLSIATTLPLQLALTPVVLVALRDDSGTEDAESGDQRVELVQRVGATGLESTSDERLIR